MAAKKKSSKTQGPKKSKPQLKKSAKTPKVAPKPNPKSNPRATQKKLKPGRPPKPATEKTQVDKKPAPPAAVLDLGPDHLRKDGRKKNQLVPLIPLKARLLAAFHHSLLPLSEKAKIPLEYAREEKFGDYATAAALDKNTRDALAGRSIKLKNPREMAVHIAKRIQETPESAPLFAKVEIAGPGFINVTIPNNVLLEYVLEAVQHPDRYGRTTLTDPKRIIFEYVSANPTGPLNVVSCRAAALGDSCSSLLQWAGETVYREYYVNDYGNQVRLLGESCFLRALEINKVPIKLAQKSEDGKTVTYPAEPGLPFPAEGYHGEIIKDVVKEIFKRRTVSLGPKLVERAAGIAKAPDVDTDFISKFPAMEELAVKLGGAAVDLFVETQQNDLKKFRVEFDSFYRESSLHSQNKVQAARNFLEGNVRTEAGKQFFESSKFGDDQDRVIIREDGRPTYLLSDIAYHKTKIDRGYTDIINIWGPDHHGYIKRLAGALQALGFPADRFKVLLAQQVNLLENGKPAMMSKRAGKFITMETLLSEIPVDVLRYFFVMRSFEAHLDFDFAEALDTTEKNPYYYVAYAHARIRSIHRKAEEKGLLPITDPAEFEIMYKLPITPDRRRLLTLVAQFPEEIQDAARAFEPHRMINYLHNLASALSKFYAPKENRVIDQDPETARALLTLLSSVAICLKNGLSILGMTAPEQMIREDEGK